MKILMLHNYYKIPGGEDVSTAMELQALRDRGHDVELLTLTNDALDAHGNVTNAIRATWSRPAAALVDKALSKHAYDVMHVQNYFPQFSPVVHRVARSRGVATVQHLRNFRYTCVDASLYRRGAHCTECVGKFVPIKGVLKKCYRDSASASLAVAAMIGTHKVIGTWRNDISRYIAISNYVKSIHMQAGLSGEKIAVRANIMPDQFISVTENTRDFVVAGRFVPEKGIDVAIRSWMMKPRKGRLLIAGSGPFEAELRTLASADASIQFLGQVKPGNLLEIMRMARCVIVPSLWEEPFGRVALESMMLGVPVIANRVGGLPDILGADSGCLVVPGDVQQMSSLINQMLDDDVFHKCEAARARSRYINEFAIPEIVNQTERIYEEALGSV